jgi:hypothetical protein
LRKALRVFGSFRFVLVGKGERKKEEVVFYDLEILGVV